MCIKNNEFIDIPNVDGYQINKLGQVLSLPKERRGGQGVYMSKSKLLNISVSRFGYKYVSLKTNGKMKHISIHRLLAIIFIPNPQNYPIINHKDGNKDNNSLDNLEWCTYKQNNDHAIQCGLARRAVGVNAPKAKLKPEDIPKIIEMRSKGTSYAEIGRKYNVAAGSIKAICVGKTWKSILVNHKEEVYALG